MSYRIKIVNSLAEEMFNTCLLDTTSTTIRGRMPVAFKTRLRNTVIAVGAVHCRKKTIPRRSRTVPPFIQRRSWIKRAAVEEEDASEGPVLERLDLSSRGGLGGTSEDVFGPLAVALVGFSQTEYDQFQDLLRQMDGDCVKTIPCSASHLGASLQTVLHLENVEFESGPLGLRRTIFLSGMYAAEVHEIISAYRDARLPPAVFAAYVPRNKDKCIADLVEEVYDDHLYMLRQRKAETKDGDVRE